MTPDARRNALRAETQITRSRLQHGGLFRRSDSAELLLQMRPNSRRTNANRLHGSLELLPRNA
jgi:hypothetical protein